MIRKSHSNEERVNYKFSIGEKVIILPYEETSTISEQVPPEIYPACNNYKVEKYPHHLWREYELISIKEVCEEYYNKHLGL